MMMVGVPCRNRDRIIIYHFKSKIMKGTEAFKRTIGEYLQVRANTDEIFAQRMKKEGKTLDGSSRLLNGYQPISIAMMRV